MCWCFWYEQTHVSTHHSNSKPRVEEKKNKDRTVSLSNVKTGWGINNGWVEDGEWVKSRTPNLFYKQPEAEGGEYVNLMKEKKIKRKEYPSRRCLNMQGIGYYLGRDPLQLNHTASRERDWGPVWGAGAAAERATQGLSFGGLWALRPQNNTGNPTQSCAGSVFHIDFSCMQLQRCF